MGFYKIVIRAFFLLSFFFLFACTDSNPTQISKNGKLQKLVIAETGTSPPALLLYIAKQQGFYDDEGLEVELVTKYGHGKANIQAMLDGKVDACTASETPVMRAGLKGSPVKVLATIGSADRHLAIVGRKDRGIQRPVDLADKKLGVTVGSNAEFFFDAFLQMRGLQNVQVEKVHTLPKSIPDVLKTGQVDAIVSWFPNWKRAQDAIGQNANLFFGDGVYTMFFNLLVHERLIDDKPEEAKALLRALIKAEKYILKHPAKAKQAIIEQFKLDADTADKIFGNYHFKIRLSQELLLTLENQARWAMRKGLTKNTRLPNYLNYIHINTLNDVEPAAVNIIH